MRLSLSLARSLSVSSLSAFCVSLVSIPQTLTQARFFPPPRHYYPRSLATPKPAFYFFSSSPPHAVSFSYVLSSHVLLVGSSRGVSYDYQNSVSPIESFFPFFRFLDFDFCVPRRFLGFMVCFK